MQSVSTINVLGRPWKSLKFDFQEGFVACYKCKRACDWCPDFHQAKETRENKCPLEDIVFPMVIGSYVKKLGIMEEIAERKLVNIDDVMAWIMQGARMLGSKCTNALVVFEALICDR
jgi:hypothetical protein